MVSLYTYKYVGFACFICQRLTKNETGKHLSLIELSFADSIMGKAYGSTTAP